MTPDSTAAKHYEDAAKLAYLAGAATGPDRDDLLARAAAQRAAGDRLTAAEGFAESEETPS